jgi:anti-sigma regulatory factor (Ser/Thr protein kinase)
VTLDAQRPAASLRIEVLAVAERLADIRRQLVTWLEPMGMSNTDMADIVLGVNEACTNCIEHAYRGIAPGMIRVDATHAARQIVVDVADFGIWQTPPTDPGDRGRGLAIMHAVSDGVNLNSSPAGTTVQLSFGADR